MNLTSVAGLDQKLDVRIHEWNSHGHRVTIWQDEVGVLSEALDDAENVVPSTAVEAGAVVAKLVDDLYIVSCGFLDGIGKRQTSSISNAAKMVSMRTVPRMVPRCMPM